MKLWTQPSYTLCSCSSTSCLISSRISSSWSCYLKFKILEKLFPFSDKNILKATLAPHSSWVFKASSICSFKMLSKLCFMWLCICSNSLFCYNNSMISDSCSENWVQITSLNSMFKLFFDFLMMSEIWGNLSFWWSFCWIISLTYSIHGYSKNRVIQDSFI